MLPTSDKPFLRIEVLLLLQDKLEEQAEISGSSMENCSVARLVLEIHAYPPSYQI